MRRFFKLHKFPTCATSIYKQQQPNLLIQIFPWLHLNQGMTKIKTREIWNEICMKLNDLSNLKINAALE